MTTERKLWATLTLGSHLYGTAVEGSDTDLLHLYIPTTAELVANRRVSIPQRIENGIDNRHLLLGDFIMSLGHNPEHMVLAYHYADLFQGLDTAWLTGRALHAMLDASWSMWDKAQTPKNRAHAYRYALAANAMAKGSPLYPLLNQFYVQYMRLRNDEPDQIDNRAFCDYHGAVRTYINNLWKSDQFPDQDRLAQWTILRYLGLA